MKSLLKLYVLSVVVILMMPHQSSAQWRTMNSPFMRNVQIDSMRISDPAVFTDIQSQCYYMTGTEGKIWKSKDLRLWEGPSQALDIDSASWIGKNYGVWAPEIYKMDDKYYFFGTFTNRDVVVDEIRGQKIPRRACQILVSDSPEGPFRVFGDAAYLPENIPTLDATFWIDSDGKPYMIYCEEWLHNWNGTVEKIELKPDLSGTVGKRSILFFASDSPWSGEYRNRRLIPNKVTDGPFVFRTDTGRLGIIWTSWGADGKYTTGVAYSSDGTLNGTWTQEKEPIITPGYGHGMLFKNLDGQWMMSIHLHETMKNGSTRRTPHFFYVDLTGDKLVVGEEFK